MKRIPKKAEMSLVRLSTYNLRVACDKAPNDWESRLPRILRLLESEQFDVFGTQEGLKRQIDDLVAGTRYAYIGVGRDDFNAHPGSATCRFASSRLKDASKLAPKRHPGPGITWHGYGMDRPGNDVIDYIYLSQGIRVRDYYIDERAFGGQFASDHYAVVADLAFPLPFAAAKAISPIRRPRR